MFNFETGKFETSANLWIDLVICAIILAFIVFSFSRVYKSKFAFAGEILLYCLAILGKLFNLVFVWHLSTLIFGSIIVVVFISRERELKKAFEGSRKKNYINKVVDKDSICEKICDAVEKLSKSKTGALITFEKNDNLNDLISTGTILNAPITSELIETIFYPGTRLHDGAIIIRKDEILAASVYFTPTKKPLSGKYGSRHRAAIGVSEMSDSVTIVISEETGRISVAYKGELTQIQPNMVCSSLKEYLAD